ncbi:MULTISPECIES: HAMP domain-containing sensor histidine kinase [Parabacteroides]|uniref:sensor histidine kinase n=1 Tax=Parabacteroides leei TaxID=2939491 RepID=UPI0018972758|nr:HAMP domain-containing sensor histidine kinase [Parabacteroides goldsteinii]
MKLCLILMYMLTNTFFIVANNATTKEALSMSLKSASSTEKKLETLTNLMDISRQEEQVEYAKELYKEALADNNDHYKEVALTEILRFYVNNDIKDSTSVYMEKARQELKGKARDFLVTYMQTIIDVRVVFYTEGEDRKKLIEQYRLKLETDKKLSSLEKMSINYVLGMAYSNRIEPGNEEELQKMVSERFKEVIALSENIPLQYSYLFRLNSFSILTLYSPDTSEQIKYAIRYLDMQNEYAETKEMKKRPYVTKRHLLNAYSSLALSAKTLGKDIATSYYRHFMELNGKYPEDAGFSAEYDRFYTSLNFYRLIEDYPKSIKYCDSIIHYFRHSGLKIDLSEHVVSTLKDKIDMLDSLHLYKEAFYAHKEYATLVDSARMKNINDKLEDLEIKKRVDELVIEKKALEIDLQKSHNQLYLFLSLFILAISSAVFVAFRLWKINSLYKKLQESNRQVILASEKAQESERMKNAFIKNMCHEVRTPLNAINGFAELITAEDISLEEKQDFSKIIFENCNHITSMMNSVLEIAQLDSNKDDLPLSAVNIHLLCSCEMEQIKRLYGKPGIEYKLEGNREKDLAFTNQSHFSLILSHLLNNANKFTEKGNITLSYNPEEEQNRMVISITDTGCGISADKREWIFERFTKANDFVPGSGLGLYLCRQIAHRMKGNICVDPDYTTGLRIILTIPIKPE